MIAQITIDDAYAYIELAVIAELLTRTDKLMFYFENMKVSLMNGITKIEKKIGLYNANINNMVRIFDDSTILS